VSAPDTAVLPPPWDSRPPEEARLLNPAFVALLIRQAADAHFRTAARPLPWVLAFLVVPVALHRGTRDALPAGVTTSMARWLQDHPELRLSTAVRGRELAPVVREGLMFGIRGGLLQVTDDGGLSARRLRRRPPGTTLYEPTDDYRDCTTRAAFMGRWCARSGTPATVMALWRMRP
jgi:Family of unknown function (DUF6521)